LRDVNEPSEQTSLGEASIVKTKHSESKDSALGDRRDVSAPYDPLDLRTLAESMVKVVLEQRIYSLGNVPSFEGAGVYVIYYTGDYDPYRSIAQKNKGGKWNQPIMWERRPEREEERAGYWRKGQREKYF
jgi:hypothetical protein